MTKALMLALTSESDPCWRDDRGRCPTPCTVSCLHVHSVTASVQELRPAALRSELASAPFGFRTPPPSQAPGPFPKNFFSWQRGYAATWEQRTFAPFGMCPD
jgi:hypothetical protein